MSYSQYFLHTLMDMGSLQGSLLRTIKDYAKLQGGPVGPRVRVPE